MIGYEIPDRVEIPGAHRSITQLEPGEYKQTCLNTCSGGAGSGALVIQAIHVFYHRRIARGAEAVSQEEGVFV